MKSDLENKSNFANLVWFSLVFIAFLPQQSGKQSGIKVSKKRLKRILLHCHSQREKVVKQIERGKENQRDRKLV